MCRQFLDDLQTRLEPVADRELATLKALKAEERAARGLAPEDTFYLWDYRYYDRLHVERSLALDDNAVKEHFPVARVVPAILGIYQDLLSVRFEEVPREHAPVWHEDVQAFAVWEKDAKAGEGFVGWCYLDLFPRRTLCFLLLWAAADARLQRTSTVTRPSSR
jgi:Zn-dependent oligopeptidase